MAYNTSQNNAKEKASVNTRGHQFFNVDGFQSSTLSVGYWNDFLSLRINLALDKSQRTDNRVYDYDKTVSTALSLRLIARLLKGINDYIVPGIELKENRSVSIQVGGDSLVTVGTGDKYGKHYCQYMAIHKELDEKTKKPQMSVFYEFATDSIIKEYDESTGEYELVTGISDEFELFVELLKAAIFGLSKGTAHGQRTVDRFNTERLNSNVTSIAEKVGAKVMTTNGGGYSSKNYVNFSTRDNDGGMEYTNLSDLESIGE